MEANSAVGVLDAAAFANHFGTQVSRIPESCLKKIAQEDFSYRFLSEEQRDKTILDVIKKLENDKQVIGAEDRRDVWEQGWREALNDYVGSDFLPEKLVPKFIRPNQPVRLSQNYVMPSSSNFELQFVEVLREWMFREFFSEFDDVHEFGCGTGFNLVSLAKIFPDKRLFGSDFVPASVELVNQIAQQLRLSLSGRLFDMISPASDYDLRPGSAVFTFGSLEQLAGKFHAFIEFLLERRPGLCLHIEPTVELYDENNLIDYLAIRFHRKRGYTEGLLPHLQTLATTNRLEILRVTRLHFGSLMMEGYNLLVWRPRT